MNDQGEKIVFLARDLLMNGFPEAAAPKKMCQITMSFKTLCLTTVLAAAGGGAITAAAVHENERPVNPYEKIEIDALVFYAAKLKGLDEAALRREVAEKVGLTKLDDLTAADFPAARRYLQKRAQ